MKMNMCNEVAALISKATNALETEDDAAEFITSICSGLGGYLFVTMDPKCHEALVDQMCVEIKQSAVNASKNPGMVLLQMMKATAGSEEEKSDFADPTPQNRPIN
ncbi:MULTISPECIES: hypothetical protein [unclassified Paenibacillus]|uniref:hypothetical protein n=1 Tax=unclassified Paenibacillus TaxID=185978 RepID=UPI0024075567|nr:MULTISPECIES: hypothetical protein [unclassified Paenibacillus]MDF9844583.1 formylglycine-generating enzyme required for sulfatase activity [Paenibacillus sp. PastF-2]MDF9851239.1 formylglycine-generating enzyme required for sulfatase activity [Paenibacillus sp. PastM-2]MDF9857768.1 formylglycine-generating enzyme required for sulfatase activity [Paenibacillus sp. PastF-1]MDH6483088.1 formylglycine-generating enzyme required for sulfatase activity [Paenibacillus sp. PastH-2]MDH6510448.1 for